jgi:two-component system response regulator HydG
MEVDNKFNFHGGGANQHFLTGLIMNQTHIIEKNIAYLPFMFLTQSMKELFYKGTVKDTACPSILITGERGTGKEVLAKSIHCNFSFNAPFVSINCVDLPLKHFEEKIDECFDVFYDKSDSASEYANSRKPTLFLRDIQKLEGNIEKDFFNLLEERLFEHYDGEKKIYKDLRLIFSYSKNGANPQGKKIFDSSLKKSFNPFMLSILPLRDRREDIKPLSLYFMDKFCKEYGKEDIGGIHSEALNALLAYEWPGNVSELKDVIENSVLLSQSPLITREDIRFNISKKSIALESFLCSEDFFRLEELESIYIQTVLRRVKMNKSKAAKILDISRNTIQRRMDSFTKSARKKKSKKKNSNQPTLF